MTVMDVTRGLLHVMNLVKTLLVDVVLVELIRMHCLVLPLERHEALHQPLAVQTLPPSPPQLYPPDKNGSLDLSSVLQSRVPMNLSWPLAVKSSTLVYSRTESQSRMEPRGAF